MDPCFETATRLARAIRNGRLSSVEATKMHLARIARLNGPINALVVVDGDGAMKAYVDQWLHLAKATGEYQRTSDKWLK